MCLILSQKFAVWQTRHKRVKVRPAKHLILPLIITGQDFGCFHICSLLDLVWIKNKISYNVAFFSCLGSFSHHSVNELGETNHNDATQVTTRENTEITHWPDVSWNIFHKQLFWLVRIRKWENSNATLWSKQKEEEKAGDMSDFTSKHSSWFVPKMHRSSSSWSWSWREWRSRRKQTASELVYLIHLRCAKQTSQRGKQNSMR